MKRMRKISIKSLSVFLSIVITLLSLPLSVFALDLATENATSDIGTPNTSSGDVFELVDRREENVKHFRLSDGTFVAAQYDIPVHTLDECGVWQDIDNTLQLTGNEHSTDDTRVKFANNTNSSKTVSVKRGAYKFSFGLIGANKGKVAVVTNPDVAQYDSPITKIEQLSTLTKLVSKVKYEDAYDNADIEYILIGRDIKENIIVKSKTDSDYAYSFEIKTNNLDVVLNNDGSISMNASNTGEEVFLIPAPYMYDSNGVFSGSVTYKLSQKGNKHIVTLTADADWINDNDRVFPVIIDPTVSYGSDGSSVSSTFVASGDPNRSYYEIYNKVGFSSTSTLGNMRTYAKLKTAPTIPVGAIVTSAKLNMMQYSYIGPTNGVEIGAYAVTGSWSCSQPYSGSIGWNDIMWNNQPTFSLEPFELKKLSSTTNNTTVTWDITKVAKQWYEGVLVKQGIVLKRTNESTTTEAYIQFYNGYGSQLFSRNPTITISYAEVKGLESYYSYYEASADLAGTAYINAFNGNLSFVHESLSTTDEIMPYTFGLVYNGYRAGEDYNNTNENVTYTSSSTGKGFKLYTDETLKSVTINGETFYIWNDADGTDHYFQYDSADGQWYDEDGLQLTLVISGDNRIILDDHGNEIHFNANGFLTQISNTQGHRRIFYRNAEGNVERVKLYPNGLNDGVDQLTLQYNENGKLKNVLNVQTGTNVKFYYALNNTSTSSVDATGYLRKIEYVYSNNSTYVIMLDYDANGRLVLAKDLKTKMALYFTYDATGRISEIHQFPNAEEISTYDSLVASLTVDGVEEPHPISGITYSGKQTTMRTMGSDDVYGTSDDVYTTDVFDYSGRPISSYSKVNGIICSAQNTEYVDSHVKTMNKIGKSAITNGVSGNKLYNPNMDSTLGSWNTHGNAYITDGSNYGSDCDCMYFSINSSNRMSYMSNYDYYDIGTYTFSIALNTYGLEDDAEVVIFAIDEYGDILAETTVTKPFSASSTMWVRKSIRFNVQEYYSVSIYVELRYKNSSGTNYSYVYADSAMLERGNGSTAYNMLRGSDFDGTICGTYNGVSVGTYTFNGSMGSLYFPSSGSYSQTITMDKEWKYSDYESEMDKRVFIFSAWGKSNSVVTDPNTNGYSTFGARVTIIYANTSFQSIYYFPFSDETSEVQHLIGVVESEPDTTGFRHHIVSIKVEILHENNPIPAYVDDIALIEDGDAVTMYEYNSMGYCTREVSSNGQEKNYTYSGGDVLTESDNNNSYSYTYLGDTHKVASVSNIKTIDGVTKGATTFYTYDEYGNVTEKKIVGYTNNYVFSKLKTLLNYDNTSLNYLGTVSSSTNIAGIETKYYYNNKAQLVATTNRVNPNQQYSSDVTALECGVIYSYNDFGQLSSATPAQMFAGELVPMSTSQMVNYFYNSRSNISSIQSESSTYEFSYNEYNRLKKVYVGEKQISEYVYNNGYGLQEAEILGNNFAVYYQYDNSGNLLGICYNGIENVAFTYKYDNAGRIVEKTDLTSINGTYTTEGTKYLYVYDGQGRILQEETIRNGETYSVIENEFDEQGRLTGKYHYYNNTSAAPLTYTEYSYDKFGNVCSVTFGGIGAECQYFYDDFGRITDKTISFGNSTPYSQKSEYGQLLGSERLHYTIDNFSGTTFTREFTYDPFDGNIRKIIDKEGGGTPGEYSYRYDQNGWLVMETFRNINAINHNQSPDGTLIYIYSYDQNGNRTARDCYLYNGFCDQSSIYYQNGIWVHKTGSSIQNLTLISSENFGYNDQSFGDILTQYSKTTLNSNGSTYSTSSYAISNDSIGNLTTFGSAFLTWRGKMLSSYNSGTGLTTYYTYNEDGMRTGKQCGTTKYLYSLEGDKINRIELYESEVLVRDIRLYYDAEGKPMAMRVFQMDSTGSSVISDYRYYIVTNALGDVRYVLDTSGNRLIEYVYDAFGNSSVIHYVDNTASVLASSNPFRYRGYFYDQESGYYYLNSRYYDPSLGRFLSMDDVAYLTADGKDHINLYVYCANNPIMHTDEQGTYVNTVTGALIGGVIGGFTALLNKTDETEMRDIWNGFLIGALSGGVAGLGLDLGLAFGGLHGLLVSSSFGGMGSGFNYILTQIESGSSVNLAVMTVEIVSGIVGNTMAYGFSPLSISRRSGNVFKNFIQDGNATIMKNTTRRVQGKVVSKTKAGVRKNIAKNIFGAFGETTFFALSTIYVSKSIQQGVQLS